MPVPLVILQAAAATAAPQPAAAPVPAIELHARVRAKSISIEQQGQARLEVRAEPGTQRVEASGKLPPGQRQATDLDLRLDATATIVDPAAPPRPPAEPAPGG